MIYENAPGWDTPAAGGCRTGMILLRDYLVEKFGGDNLGCYNPRAKTGGSSPSLHRDGRAIDIGFSGALDVREVAFDWLVRNAAALRLQMVLNYAHGEHGGTRWRLPYSATDTDAGLGTWGKSGHWLHIERTTAGADDPTPIAELVDEVDALVPVVDISKWQGSVDFAKLAATGVAGVIARARNGKQLGPDPRFDDNVRGAVAAGLPVGAYYWHRPLGADTPEEQADTFLADVNTHGDAVRFLMLDAEWYWEADETPLAPADMTAWLDRFLARLEEVDDRPVVIYTNENYWSQHVASADILDRYPTILASYPHGDKVPPSTPSEWSEWAGPAPDSAGWQFTASLDGPAFGVESAGLDGNLVDPVAWSSWTTVDTPAPPPPPEPTPPPPTRRLYTVNVNLPKLAQNRPAEPTQTRMAQAVLNAKSGAGLSVDGKFGAKTKAAVVAWQKWHRLEVDGIVGPNTWRSLLEASRK